MKKRILSLLCIIIMLLPMLLSCDNLNESESTTPKQEEETTTAPEDLSDIPVRDVSDYPNDSFYLSEEEKAYLESQGVNPDQFLCKVFGGWNWLDYADYFEWDSEQEHYKDFWNKPFNVKKVLDFQYPDNTHYIYSELTDYRGWLSERVFPETFSVTPGDEAALLQNIYIAGRDTVNNSSTDWLLKYALLDTDNNGIHEPFEEDDKLEIFSCFACTKDLKGLTVEKMYIMRPSSGAVYFPTTDTMAYTFYDMFIYYVTNYGDYIFFSDRIYFFLMPLDVFENYLEAMRCYVYNNGNNFETILDSEYRTPYSPFLIPTTTYYGREFSPDHIYPTTKLYPYVLLKWKKANYDAFDKMRLEGIYP